MAETKEKAPKVAAEAKPEIVISTKEILDMLNRGIDRKGIAKHYGVPQSVIKRLFDSVESLKGKKTKPTAQFKLIDDAAGKTTPEVVSEAEVVAPAANTEAKAPEAEQPVAQPQTNAAGQW